MTHLRDLPLSDHIVELLPAYVGGTLDEDEAMRVHGHLRRCAECRAELTSWQAIADATRTAAAWEPTPAAPVLNRVWAAVDRESWQPSARPDDYIFNDGKGFAKESAPMTHASRRLTAPRRMRQVVPRQLSPSGLDLDRSGRRHSPWAIAEAAAAILLVGAVIALLGVLYRQAGDDPPNTTDAPAAAASTPSVEIANIEETPDLADCTTEPRPERTIESFFADGSPEPPPGRFHRSTRGPYDAQLAFSMLDGDFLTMGAETADQAAIDAVAATVAQLHACRYYASSSGGGTVVNGRFSANVSVVDGRYFANFSDDFFLRELAGYKEMGWPLTGVGGWLPRFNAVPEVEQVWRLSSEDDKVIATIREGGEDRGYHAEWRIVMIFVRVGDRWLVDEIARATFDDLPPAPPARTGPEILDFGIYDDDPSSSDNANHSLFGQYAFDYPFYADGGLIIRLVNMGTLPHRFTIPSLGIDQTLAPEKIVDVPIDAPIGEYEWAIYEGDDEEPTATGTLKLVEPGTPRSLG